MVSANFPNRPFALRENVWLKRQDVANNRSLMGWELWIDKLSYSPTWSGNKAHRAMQLNGGDVHRWTGNGFDFRNGNNFLLASGEVWIGHNADGTKYLNIAAQADFDILGYASLTSGVALPTIPRASQPRLVPNDVNAGSGMTIHTDRASSSFHHRAEYHYGNLRGIIAEGIGGSVGWTPPLNLLTQIPNATRGHGTISLFTYTGTTHIGTKSATIYINAPASVVPTMGNVSVSEAVPEVASKVGAYVQGLSKIRAQMDSASGVYGSWIEARGFVVGNEPSYGLTGDGPYVGTTAEPIQTAGETVPVEFAVRDSRKRHTHKTVNIRVLPYTTPKINSLTVTRADSSGAAHPEGTYLRVQVNAAVASLMNTTQRNKLYLRVYTRLAGTTAWTLRGTPVNGSTTLTVNNSYTISGPFDVTSSYDVRVELADEFNTFAQQQSVAVAKVLMHWHTDANADPALAVGKYWERGTLDVGGDIYSSGKKVQVRGSADTKVHLIPTPAVQSANNWQIFSHTLPAVDYDRLITLGGLIYVQHMGGSALNSDIVIKGGERTVIIRTIPNSRDAGGANFTLNFQFVCPAGTPCVVTAEMVTAGNTMRVSGSPEYSTVTLTEQPT